MKNGAILLFFLLFLCQHAAADGILLIEDQDMWFLQPEETQLAAVHYDEGMENLLLVISPGEDFNGSRALWIFPVPAAPENVSINVLKGFPRLGGQNFVDSYTSVVKLSAAAQVVYATFPLCLIEGAPTMFLSAVTYGMAGNVSMYGDIEIYERIEKMGLTSEVVSAKNADALQEYLVAKGMEENNDERALLQDYIGKDYSFVIVYISDLQKFKEESDTGRQYYGRSIHENLIGVFVRFPSDRIFYPLRPTAAYGSQQVPVVLYVTGFVSPNLYDSIREGSSVTYFEERYFKADDALSEFFNGKTTRNNLKYTKVKIDTPASRFTEDLWIDPVPPSDIAAKDLYLQGAVFVAAISYILFSMTASLAAGMLAFRKNAVDRKILLIHGIWNCTTFIGFVLATRKKFPQDKYRKRGPYVLAFYFIFAGLATALALVLSPDLVFTAALAWTIGLLAPLLSLLLLLLILPLFSGVYYMDAGGMIIAVIVSIFLIILALCPIPVLIWLKRWLDPVQPEPEKEVPK